MHEITVRRNLKYVPVQDIQEIRELRWWYNRNFGRNNVKGDTRSKIDEVINDDKRPERRRVNGNIFLLHRIIQYSASLRILSVARSQKAFLILLHILVLFDNVPLCCRDVSRLLVVFIISPFIYVQLSTKGEKM